MADAAVVHAQCAGTVGGGEVSGARAPDAGGVGGGGDEGNDYAGVLEGRVEGCVGSVASIGDAGGGCDAGNFEE